MDPNTRHTTTKKLPSCRGEERAVLWCTFEPHTESAAGRAPRGISCTDSRRYYPHIPFPVFLSGVAAVWAFIGVIPSTLDKCWPWCHAFSKTSSEYGYCIWRRQARLLHHGGEMQNVPDIKMTSITLIVFSPVSRQSVFVLFPLGTNPGKRELGVTRGTRSAAFTRFFGVMPLRYLFPPNTTCWSPLLSLTFQGSLFSANGTRMCASVMCKNVLLCVYYVPLPVLLWSTYYR